MMINTERLEKLKGSKWFNIVAKSIIPAILLFILQWHWTLNDRIARLEEKTKQDKVQWQAIKEMHDIVTEQEVRLKVAEEIQDWSILSGIFNNSIEGQTSGDKPSSKSVVELKKMLKELNNKKSKAPKKEVDQFIRQQMAK